MTDVNLFPTSVVGSIPRSAFVRNLILEEAGLPDERQAATLDAAVRYIVAMQEHAGLDVVTDGEWRRKSYIGVIAELAHGFELGTDPADGRPLTFVVDKLTARQPGFIAREISFVKSITTRRVKATLPAPALLGERLWHPQKSAGAYPRREDFVRACVPILRRELEMIRDAGADIVQIDDPHLCLFVDPTVRAGYDDPEQAADFAVDMVNLMTDGLDGIQTAVHLCRRAGARARGKASFAGGFAAIIDHINRLQVDHLTMEFTAPGAGDVAVLGKLRRDVQIGLGCVSVTPGVIDTAQTIVDRVEQALTIVDKERITLNPDCGFAPGAGANVSIDEVYGKLCNQVTAALILRDRYQKRRPQV